MKTQLHSTATYSANRTLETIIWVGVISLLIIMFSYSTASANHINFEDESYINDIPFDTEMIVNEMMNPEFNFEDEAYIDDIPFNTECVAINCNYRKAMAVPFEMPEESFIEDLPFNTAKIATEHTYNQTFSIEFTLEDEGYVEDMPFNTYSISKKYNEMNCTKLYVSGK